MIRTIFSSEKRQIAKTLRDLLVKTMMDAGKNVMGPLDAYQSKR